MREHDDEPVRGLPERLPDGERLIWQGAPDWRVMAVRVFHVRLVAAYFLAMMAWRATAASAAGASLAEATGQLLGPLIGAGLTLALLCGLSVLMARTTVYTITSKRLVLRFGVAIQKAINIPFAIVHSAAVKAHRDGGGDIALTLGRQNVIAYPMLWPHVRPWKLTPAQPALRALANVHAVAALLTDAIRAHAPQTIVASATTSAGDAPVGAPVAA
ncbi:MAG: photosynthetic complex putative assembly protein PuhB [Hyphomonadaceae bacterium]|nr:photosynthetic complex putative assembly protein PuhB [Hyphomonadaceae bacterium]